jgi:hypothetical protein
MAVRVLAVQRPRSFWPWKLTRLVNVRDVLEDRVENGAELLGMA